MKHNLAAISAVSLIALVSLGGCASMNGDLASRTTQTQFFRVYDIKTDAQPTSIGQAAANGISKDIEDIHTTYPINMSGVVPTTPGHMELKNPLAGTSLAAFASMAGSSTMAFEQATCNGAAWTATSVRRDDGNYGQNFSFCLFPYKGGYQLDMYGLLTVHNGGINFIKSIGNSMVRAMLGSPTQFMNKAFADTLSSIHSAMPDAKISYVRGQPAPGPLPWVSSTPLGK